MPGERRGFFERTGRGHERIVIVNRGRASSHGKSTKELLDEAEEREQALISQVTSLNTRLSIAERNEWNMRQNHNTLVHEHNQCRNLRAQLEHQINEVRRFDGLLADQEDRSEKYKAKVEKLEEKVRLLKRGMVEDYRSRYDKAMEDVDLLAQKVGEKNDELRVADTRIAEKNRTIVYLRNYLQQLGYSVRNA